MNNSQIKKFNDTYEILYSNYQKLKTQAVSTITDILKAHDNKVVFDYALPYCMGSYDWIVVEDATIDEMWIEDDSIYCKITTLANSESYTYAYEEINDNPIDTLSDLISQVSSEPE